jgi:hypothetical protein
MPNRSLTAVAALAVTISFLIGCAAAIPSSSSGTSTPQFQSAAEVPKQVRILSGGIPNYDPVGQVLQAELPALGYIVVEDNAQAVFDAYVRYSDFSPVHLSIALTEVGSGRVLWSAKIVREWDMYASVVSASESNARRAMALLREDLAKVRANR